MVFNEIVAVAPLAAFALAVVATLAYVMGRRSGRDRLDADAVWRELKRAKAVLHELEGISQHVRRSLATHHTSILQFRDRLSELGEEGNQAAWKELCDEAERMLKPTMRLSTEMAQAYDEIRQQTNLLMSFTDSRTDPLTGLNNRRALEEALKALFAIKTRYNTDFSIALIDIDHFKQLNDQQGHLIGDQVLQQFAEMMDKSVRETDSVARFGGEEFVVIMPHTDLEGSCVFASRLRELVEETLPVTISIGVTLAMADDSIQTLMTRADAALYSAKSAGRNCVFQHSGRQIELVDMPQTVPLDAGQLERDVPPDAEPEESEPQEIGSRV